MKNINYTILAIMTQKPGMSMALNGHLRTQNGISMAILFAP